MFEQKRKVLWLWEADVGTRRLKMRPLLVWNFSQRAEHHEERQRHILIRSAKDRLHTGEGRINFKWIKSTVQAILNNMNDCWGVLFLNMYALQLGASFHRSCRTGTEQLAVLFSVYLRIFYTLIYSFLESANWHIDFSLHCSRWKAPACLHWKRCQFLCVATIDSLFNITGRVENFCGVTRGIRRWYDIHVWPEKK